MYEYKYVSVESTGVMVPEFKGQRELIDRCAADGWRFAGWVPVRLTTANYGALKVIDLIFEREI